MAQSGYTPILIYASGTTTNTPSASNLTSGSTGAELAINYTDGKLFYKDNSGVVQVIASKATGTVAGATTQIIYNNSGAYAGSANLTFSGSALTIGVQGTTQGSLVLGNTATTFSTTIKSSNSSTVAWTLTLPVSAGTNGYVLSTNGSGVTSWIAASGGSVTSVAMTVPAFLSVSGSPITSSGTLSVSLSGTALPIANGGTGSTSTTYCSLTTNVTGTLPVANGGTGITSFGTGISTWLGTPSSANLLAAMTDETGSGSLVFATSPTLVTPILGTPTSGTLSNCTVDGTAGNNVGFINIPQLSKTSAYVLAAADRGKHVSITTGGVTVNVSTFAAGDAVTIYNNSASSQTITQGTSATMYLAGTATTGNRTLAQRGVCTILCVTGGASAVYVISGAGLT
jgi:hypothetical protein